MSKLDNVENGSQLDVNVTLRKPWPEVQILRDNIGAKAFFLK